MPINLKDKILLLLICLVLSLQGNAQIEVNTNVKILGNLPIDTRDTLGTLADTSGVDWKYPGLMSYVVALDEFWYYNGSAWQKWISGEENTLYKGGTFTLGSTHDLLEDAIASYSTRFRSPSIGTWMGVTSDTANNKLGLRWSTLQGTHEVMSSLSGLQLLSGSDMTFKLSNGLKRFYFDGGFDTDNTNTQALSVDPVTKELEVVDLYQPVAGRNVEISGDTINANTDVGRRLFVDKANYTGTPVPGDPAQPFRDPWQAIDSFQVGDIIEVLAGTYIAVDSARIGTYPGYDVIVTQEDRYRYNFMSKDQTYFLFRPGTKIQWSALESYLAWDTLGYSMKMVGDVVIETTEEGGNIFVLNDNDNIDQPSNLEVEVESIIGPDTGPSTSGKPTLFYLANGNNVKINVDQIDGLYRLVYYDGLYGINNSNVYVGRWLCDFGDYNIQIGGDTLRNQNHQIRIDFVNIADHDYIFFETNRTYYWDNTNFKLSIGQLLADRVNINTTRGGFDSEGLVYALLGGAFWDNAIYLQNSNFIIECENYYGNVPLLQMIYAPNATQTENFNFEFRGNYVYHTDYIGSTGTQPLFGPRSWTPPPGFQVTLNGTFVTQDTVNLISTRIGDVRLQGLFKNAGSEPVLNIETESNGTVELLNAHLVNDGTAPEVTAQDAKNVFLRTRWEPSNVDTNVVFQRYPLYATNPYLGANTVQGSIDSLYANMGAGGGGSSTLAGLSDTDLTGLADGDLLQYNSGTDSWRPTDVGVGTIAQPILVVQKTTDQTLTTSPAAIASWSAPIKSTSMITFDATNGFAIIDSTALYEVSFWAWTNMTSGTVRRTSVATLQISNGSGWTDIAGMTTEEYNRQAGDGSGTMTIIYSNDFSAGDSIRVVISQNAGTETIVLEHAYFQIKPLQIPYALVGAAASESNDLTASVTWATVPDAYISESSVNQYVEDAAYGAGWNGDLSAPTKNAVYDKIQTIGSDGNGIVDDLPAGNVNIDVNGNYLSFTDMCTDGGQLHIGYVGDNYLAMYPTHNTASLMTSLRGMLINPSLTGNGDVLIGEGIKLDFDQSGGTGKYSIARGLYVPSVSGNVDAFEAIIIDDQTTSVSSKGIEVSLSSGANKWNIYADGTAQSYFAGDIGINDSSPDADLDVNGDAIVTGVIYLNDAKTVGIFHGTGSPEGVVTASVGSTYHRTDGGTGTTLYVKESGSGNTGWIAK